MLPHDQQTIKRWPWIKHLFTDGAYDRRKLMDKPAFEGFVVEVVRRIGGQPGVNVLSRRWVVECTFAWMTAGAASSATTKSASTSSRL